MILDDLRHAGRTLAQSPTFTLVAVASLAIGIGANTALFSFLHGMVLAPLPYPDSERMVLVQESVEGRDANGSPQRFKDWAAEGEVFDAATAWYSEAMTLTGGDKAEAVEAYRTFGDLQATFALRLAAGRGFSPTEIDGREPAALLTESFWRRRFAADPAVAGRIVTLNGRSFTIAGVLAGELGSGHIDLVVPEPQQNMPRSARFLRQVARLRSEVGLERASERLATLATHLRAAHPADDRGLAVRLIPYREVLGREARGPLAALLGAVAFVLLSACFNVASLLVERARRRSGELAVRLALGAGRGRLARLLLAEGTLLALAGGILGLACARAGIHLLKEITPAHLPRLNEVQLSWPTLLFGVGLAALTALLASVPPMARGMRAAPAAALAAASRRTGGRRTRATGALVVAQVAISLALLFGSGLLLRTLSTLTARPLGFETEHLLAFGLPVPWQTPDAHVQRFQAAVLAELRALPGVTAVELTDRLPLEGGTQDGAPLIEGRSPESLPAGATLGQRQVSAGYLPLMRVPLLRGRGLALDDVASGEPVAVLNQRAVDLYFPSQDPLGARVALAFGNAPPRYYRVVGVVGDLPSSIAESAAPPEMFTAIERGFWPIASFVVETALPPAAAQEAIRSALARSFPDKVPEDFRTLPGVVASSVAQPRLTASLVTVFAVAALLLAAAGIYGLFTNAVTARRFELGVRLAVGARREDLQRLVFGSALPLLAAGLALGAAGCWVVKSLVASLLVGVSPLDPASVAGALGILAVTAAFAIAVPARRAARTEPAVVLRGE